MATSAGPNLEGVKNNDLLLSFDAHDAKSYPGEPTMNMVQLPNNLTATSNWNVTNGTLANDQIDGPNGRRAGSLTATDSDPYIYSSYIFYVATGSLTFSAYVKGSSDSIGMGGDIRINFGTSAGQATGSNTTSNYTITGDWQRVSVTATVTGAGTIKVGIEAPNSATVGRVVYIADMQLEQKAKATPFVVGPNPNDTGTYMGRPATVDFMLHGNVGTGTTFSDSGKDALTITNNNSVTHSAVSKFNGGSIKFVRSSSQQLTTASTSNINFGTGNWTIDFWFNITNGSTDRMHAVSCGTGNTNNLDFNFNDTSAFWLYWNGVGSNNVKFGSDGDYGDGQWHHCAATRYNGMVRVWIDGVHKGSNNYNSSTAMGQTASIYVGGKNSVYWDGYLDEVRVVKGTALWKGSNDFLPPTRRGAGGPLISRSGNNKSGSLINGAGVEATGPTTRRDGQVILPIADSYLDFDGTDDYGDFGSIGSVTAFTVELWIYPDVVQDYQNPIDCNYAYNGTTGNIGPRLELRTGTSPNWLMSGDTSSNNNYYYINARSSAPSAGKWYHAVLTYDGSGNTSGVRSYWNGSFVAAGLTNVNSPSSVWVNTMNGVELGHGFHLGSSRHFNGRIAKTTIYRKNLTAAQIKQNFNQQRNRFGI